MCLETSKQAYAFLQAFADAGERGLTYPTLMKKMAALSVAEFGTDIYVSAPVPLMTILRRHEFSEGIISDGKGTFRVTDLGLRGLDLLIGVAIEPRRRGQQAA